MNRSRFKRCPSRPLEQREPEFLHVPEGPQPQQLLLQHLQRPDQPLDAAVPLGSTDGGRARLDAEEGELHLEGVADVLE